ncbi:MAG: nitroreductase [Porticoccaceae bacterium]|nr:nitroreductase [Porticoccaceae bacterium]
MELLEAVSTRISARAFLDTPVSKDIVHKILDHARLAPSGSNMQPWHIHAVTGQAREALIEKALAFAAEHPIGSIEQEYQSPPKNFINPYKARRYACGMALYSALNIDRKDKEARAKQLMQNFYFFGAPVGLIFSMHRSLMPGQLGDLGILMGNVMLIAREYGLHSCAQGFWQDVQPAIREVLDIPEEHYIYNGIALGYLDEGHPANSVKPGREALENFTEFVGFE